MATEMLNVPSRYHTCFISVASPGTAPATRGTTKDLANHQEPVHKRRRGRHATLRPDVKWPTSLSWRRPCIRNYHTTHMPRQQSRGAFVGEHPRCWRTV